jgi:hypothetical protein
MPRLSELVPLGQSWLRSSAFGATAIPMDTRSPVSGTFALQVCGPGLAPFSVGRGLTNLELPPPHSAKERDRNGLTWNFRITAALEYNILIAGQGWIA